MRLVSQAASWGNSLGVRIPKHIASKLDIRSGDELEIVFEEENEKEGYFSVNKLNRKPTYDLAKLMANATQENRHEIIDWGKPVGREEI